MIIDICLVFLNAAFSVYFSLIVIHGENQPLSKLCSFCTKTSVFFSSPVLAEALLTEQQ